MGTPEKTNRLIESRNPYLLQHARNPVDWYPWSSDAFVEAVSRDKPIFLSIGYSTCHWCHVMEAESFSDPEVAGLMNDTFVCIKVDREERPDLDAIYMAACRQITGSGGWPTTIIMTPDKKPFFAGTYFPRNGEGGRIGMLQLIPKVRDLWENRKGKAQAAAEEVVASLRTALSPEPGGRPRKEMVEEAFRQISGLFDEEYGGFGTAPKFPTPVNLFFLLRHWLRSGKPENLDMCRQTLQAMRQGGIYDHIGYGIHRYSTDRRWLVPHFEKTLYDQALVAMACIETFQATHEDEFKEMAQEILLYALRDLKSPNGGFYSGENADSNGVEGGFYTWTAEEIDRILTGEERTVARNIFIITEGGNEPARAGPPTGRNILRLKAPFSSLSKELGFPSDRLREILKSVRDKLLEARSGRTRPSLDTKVMTDWNGLMIAALSMAAGAFEEPYFADEAHKTLAHILENMRGEGDHLLHVRYGRKETIPAFLDDYAYLLWGMMELYQSTFKSTYLTGAISLADEMVGLFWDDEGDGFFFSPRGSGPLPFRYKSATDGALPSGNAVAAMNLLRIGRLTAKPAYGEMAASIGKTFCKSSERNSPAHIHLFSAFNMALNPGTKVLITGNPSWEDTLEMISVFRRSFLPNTVAAFIPSTSKTPSIAGLIPYVKNIGTFHGQATAYVFEDFLSRAPTTDPKSMISTIIEVERNGGEGN